MGSGTVRSFNPEGMLFVWNGIIFSGFAQDAIEIDYDEDRYSAESGADGEVALIKNPSEMGTVKVVLLQTSITNDYLSAKHEQHRLGLATGRGPFLFKDSSGRSVAESPVMWIKKTPPMGYGVSHKPREWLFGVGKLLMNIAGN